MCVCVCVCAPTVFKLGPQIDFCVFCTSLRYFRRIPTHMQPKSVYFPLPLLVPLALLSNVYTATAIISMFSSSRLDLCTTILSNMASPRVPNTTVNTVRAKSKHHEVLAESIKKQRCLLCSWERSCSFPIKNGLYCWGFLGINRSGLMSVSCVWNYP